MDPAGAGTCAQVDQITTVEESQAICGQNDVAAGDPRLQRGWMRIVRNFTPS